MRILYGKKKSVPDLCPKCGSSKWLKLKKDRAHWLHGRGAGQSIIDFGDELAMYMHMWKPVLGSYPGATWAPCWYGACGSCTLDEEIFRQAANPLFGKAQGPRSGTYVIPLSKKSNR